MRHAPRAQDEKEEIDFCRFFGDHALCERASVRSVQALRSGAAPGLSYFSE
jgi:hypothetical protein